MPIFLEMSDIAFAFCAHGAVRVSPPARDVASCVRSLAILRRQQIARRRSGEAMNACGCPRSVEGEEGCHVTWQSRLRVGSSPAGGLPGRREAARLA